ncbi:hypothetical protein R1sor_001742 [Riccia sorocarpa]|uniref:Lipocalin/cytosolic fatty-acid binding domain-containing protein n=1 Tax=Riccia sorocarpa TaxID=122646 RepID=A0ABD3GZZ3_9MARC
MGERGLTCLLLLLLIFQTLRPGSCQPPAPPTFCSRTLSRWTCPATLPTFDQVDLNKYSGRWYEIGSNGYFKGLQEAGGECISAFYTPQPDGSIQVFNGQTRVLGALGTSLVRGISVSAAGICQNARQICSEISPMGSISQGIRIIQQVATNISQSYYEESCVLVESKAKIDSSLMTIDKGLDSLSQSVSQIQVLNIKLSQAEGKAKDEVAELTKIAAQVNNEIEDNIPALLESIASARKKVTELAGKLYQKDDTKEISQQLFRAVSSIQEFEESLSGHAATIRATVAATADSAASFAYEKNEGVGGFYGLYGKAVAANATAPGKLSVTFEGIPTPPGKYWILKVADEKSESYGAAIVYGCSDIPGAGTYQPLFFLSREPTLSEDVNREFTDYVRSLGIYSECHEVFVPSSQPASFMVSGICKLANI